LEYVTSQKVNDWRYRKEESGIMTTLYIGKYLFGQIKPSDDISELKWFNPSDISIENDIMDEHKDLFKKLLTYLEKNKIK
jgi:bifunctional NMN adenylyltransferase/nudix hydrolase